MKQTFFSSSAPGPELDLQLLRWFSSKQGKRLLELETTCANQLMSQLFGHYLVAAGFPGDFKSPGIRLPVILGSKNNPRSHVHGTDLQMPFQTDSIDAVLLAHALDFAADPHQIVREADRILIPEGRVIIFGFNPYSIWGLQRMIRLGSDEIPPGTSFIAQHRVVDWLRLLGFTIENEQRLMFAPPLKSVKGIRGISFLQKVGKKLWTPLSAVYVIQAVKRVCPLTRIKPSWKLKQFIQPPITETATISSPIRLQIHLCNKSR